MPETRAEAWENVAGLLTRMGYAARVDPAYRNALVAPGPVLALVTCAPPMVIGMCLGQVAEEPEAHLPTRSAKVARTKTWEPGDPLFAHWA
jgi:hypothetical protein